jgi:hypothetical protein
VHRSLALAAALSACSPERSACDSGEGCDAAIDAPATAWKLGPPLPRRALAPGVALFGQRVVVAGGLVAAAGEGGAATPRVDAFDVADEVWRPLPDAPVAWTDSNLAVIGATLYMAGGLDGGAARGDAYQLDPLDEQWKPFAGLDPTDARGAAGVATAPGRIFLIGGVSSTAALATCLEYDVLADQWTHLPDLPAPRAHPAVMRRSDGALIVAGGFASFDTSEPRSNVWLLPPPGAEDRSWRQGALMRLPGSPEIRGGCAYGVVLGNLVCAGGQAGGAVRTAVDSYDPYLDHWTVGEPMPVARTATQGAAFGGKLFVPGGAGSAALEPTDTLYIYSPLDAE